MDTNALERPHGAHGPLAWLRKNLFRTWFDSLLTLFVAVIVVTLLVRLVEWVTSEAQWAVVTDNFRGLMQGLYPIEQGWRLALAVVVATLLAGVSWAIWGRLTANVLVPLIGAAAIIVIVPMVNRAAWGDGVIGKYLGDEIVPLFDLLRIPVLALVLCLLGGYLLGRVLKNVDRPRAGRLTLILWLVMIPITFILVRGIGPDVPALPLVPTNVWGGLLLTFMLAFVAIVCCFPLGVLLALGRSTSAPPRNPPVLPPRWWLNPIQWRHVLTFWWRSQGHYPIIKIFCVIYIEFLRGVPLVTVFFAANYIVPFALGIESSAIDAVARAMVALTLFEAAYIAEIVRGGLQALPPGQAEAAKALGLGSFQATLLIVLPQALRLVIPALVGQFITMFKDTSLVVLIGLLDLLGTAQSFSARQEYAGRTREVFLFVALVYFVFSFGMSRAARQLERSGSGRLRRVG